MKKIYGLLAALMILGAATVYAGGDKVCGDYSEGPVDTSADIGDRTQNRTPLGD
jgi:hypothetical protein